MGIIQDGYKDILILYINNKYSEELSYVYWIFLQFLFMQKNDTNK